MMNGGSMSGLYNFHQSGDFETILDIANEKFLTAAWRDMAEWAPMQKTAQWNAKMDGVKLISLPDVTGNNSNKRSEGVTGFSAISGTFPHLSKQSILTGDDVMSIMEYEYDNNGFVDELRKMYLGNAERMIGAFHLQIQSWCYEALSTGKISVTAAMNQGLPYEADFEVPAANKKTLATKWFTASGEVPGSDPIKDLQDMVKAAKKLAIAYDHFKMSKDLYEKFITHSKVVAYVAARLSSSADFKPNQNEIRTQLATNFDIPPIQVVDEQTWANENGFATVAPDHFNKGVVVLCKSGILFSIKNKINEMSIDNNPNVDFTFLEDGRIGVCNEYSSNPMMEKTSYELWAVPVLKAANQLLIWTVI